MLFNLVKIICTLALLSIFVTAAPQDRGSYKVDRLGERKKAILANGGGIWDIAIAMLETDHLDTNYTYGDNKSGDSANFGIFKQNFFMLRTSTEQFKKYKDGKEYNKGAILNKHLKMDIKARQESQKFYGADKWFGGHRFGETGLKNPYTQDITNYKNGVNWIHDQLASDPKFLKDDTRFWVNVVAI